VSGRRPSRRLVLLAMLAAALAGTLLGLIQGPEHREPVGKGGSRFGPATDVHRGESLVDALAPLLESSTSAPSAGTKPAADDLSRGLAQLFVVGIDGTTVGKPTLARLRAHDWGGVVLGRPNYVSQAQLTSLTAAIRGALGTTPLILARQAGGQSNGFPGLPPQSEPSLGAIGRADLVDSRAVVVAQQMKALGVNTTLAPVADIADIGGPAAGRGYGANAALVTTLVHAAVTGYKAGGLIAVAGHFPGEGAASADPALSAATVGLQMSDLSNRDLKPFAAIATLAPVIQLSDALYAAFDGVTPATLLSDTVTLLRQTLHFKGVVMSGDLLAVTAATGGTVPDAAVRALKAGCDLLFLPGGATDAEAAYNAVLAAIRAGQLDPKAIAASIGRVAALKKAYRIVAGA